jgi:hypothetical protein
MKHSVIKQTIFMGIVLVSVSSISAMDPSKSSLGSLLAVLRVGENHVQQIDKAQLDSLIGKPVLFKFNESDYKQVLLGDKTPGADFYAAHLSEGKIIYCLPESLYQFRK